MLCQEPPARAFLQEEPPAAPDRHAAPGSARAADGGALPTGVLDWLPFLWGRVLFPGEAAQRGDWGWGPFLAVALLSGVVLYPCLSFHLFEPDEGRYAQIPAEMLARGDWLVPTLQGEPYLDKPPLFYWSVMLAYSVFGVHAWAARLVPALAMHGCVLVTYLLGRRLLGGRAALWGALLLTASPAFLGMGRLLLLDGLLTFWVTLGTFSIFLAQRDRGLHRGWWLTAAGACGLGVLTKGPVALVLVLPPLLLDRRLRPGGAPIGWRAWAGFAAVILAVTLPWYVAVCGRLPGFARHFLWEHNVLRFVQPFDHERPVWFYAPILLGGLLPVTLLGYGWARFLLSGDPEARRARSPEMGYLLLAGGWCVLFFSLSGCKLPTYVLPAFGPLCLAAGGFVAGTAWHRARAVRAAVAGCWLMVAAGHFALVPWYAAHRSPLKHADAVRALCDDPAVPVVCFPRNVDSVAFELGRADFRTYRSKHMAELFEDLGRQPRTVVLFGHRNSLATFRHHLPPHLRVTADHSLRDPLPPLLRPLGEYPIGLCDIAVVER
jgi:hypothetical protein